MMENQNLQLALGVVANLLFAVVAFLYKRISGLVRGRRLLGQPIVTTILILLWILGYTLSYLYLGDHAHIFAFLFTGTMFLLLISLQIQFWMVGVVSADSSVKNGISYDKSLAMVTNEFCFLGIGAGKLTDSAEFQNAMRRCRGDKPIRFLLCAPSEDKLRRAAKRAGKDQKVYKEIVYKSIRRIAEIKEQLDLNIEVRFYKKTQPFRLMFVNSSRLLLSYYVWGDGDGSQLPQMLITEAPITKRVADSFYLPFREYYEALWEESKECCLKNYKEEISA